MKSITIKKSVLTDRQMKYSVVYMSSSNLKVTCKKGSIFLQSLLDRDNRIYLPYLEPTEETETEDRHFRHVTANSKIPPGVEIIDVFVGANGYFGMIYEVKSAPSRNGVWHKLVSLFGAR